MRSAGEPPEITALEDEVKRIADVSAARVVSGPDGTVTEVHVIASTRRNPKQIVRDVESVALAEFGIDIDRRVVSVVQFDRDAGVEDDASEGEVDDDVDHPPVIDVASDEAEEHAAPAGDDGTPAESTACRYAIDSVSVHRTREEYRVAVGLRRPGSYVTGDAVGFPVGASYLTTVAEATLDALRKTEATPEHFVLGRALVLPLDGLQVALATVLLVAPPTEEVLAGTAVVHGGQEAEAVVRAVLAATNRRLAPVA